MHETPDPAPEQPLAAAPARRLYGTDTAAVIDDYPDFKIFSFPGGDHGARAQDGDGHLIAGLITATSLDELAGKLDARRLEDARNDSGNSGGGAR
ncbi:MAG TPA: hypothetical protein VK586_12605 [Streptosporangiaceae bacterium]|nr:hypothetical protein [Streptosporangiaceae bacterium]